MQVMSTIDRLLHALLSPKWDEARFARYFDGIVARDAVLTPGMARTFQSLDAKSTGLLTHVSMMIAGLGVCATFVADNIAEQAVIVVEIMVYLLIAVGCLRCIAAIGAGDPAVLEGVMRRELVTRQRLYMLCNHASIVVTMIVFVSLPILLAV